MLEVALRDELIDCRSREQEEKIENLRCKYCNASAHVERRCPPDCLMVKKSLLNEYDPELRVIYDRVRSNNVNLEWTGLKKALDDPFIKGDPFINRD